MYHHALVVEAPRRDVDNSFKIIHYLNLDDEGRSVGIEEMFKEDDDRFRDVATVWLLPRDNYYDHRYTVTRSPEVIVQIAREEMLKSRLGCGHFVSGNYNVITNNCEHFCTFCVVGGLYSYEVRAGATEAAAHGGLVALSGSAVAAAIVATGPIGWTVAGACSFATLGVGTWRVPRLARQIKDVGGSNSNSASSSSSSRQRRRRLLADALKNTEAEALMRSRITFLRRARSAIVTRTRGFRLPPSQQQQQHDEERREAEVGVAGLEPATYRMGKFAHAVFAPHH